MSEIRLALIGYNREKIRKNTIVHETIVNTAAFAENFIFIVEFKVVICNQNLDFL
jgi:hypothetical protein